MVSGAPTPGLLHLLFPLPGRLSPHEFAGSTPSLPLKCLLIELTTVSRVTPFPTPPLSGTCSVLPRTPAHQHLQGLEGSLLHLPILQRKDTFLGNQMTVLHLGFVFYISSF